MPKTQSISPKITPVTVNGMERPENFPVASFLLRAEDRQVVQAFYDFARFADDIADSTLLGSDEKITALNILDEALLGACKESDMVELRTALALRQALRDRGLTTQHASELLVAFRQDSENHDTKSWDELLEYCRYSAAPVGRFLLDLYGESKAARKASDALCAALQILNHVQDLAEDHKLRNRHYIPLFWLGIPNAEFHDLEANSLSPNLMGCVERTLSATGALLAEARKLPFLIRSKRLRAEATAIVSLAFDLHQALQDGDPIARRIRPTKIHGFKAMWRAIWSFCDGDREPPLLTPRANSVVTAIVDASGSSFQYGMRSLPLPRRQAMYTIYAFCRVVDDIADDEGVTQQERLDALDKWDMILNSLERGHDPDTASPLIQALQAVDSRYGLNYAECRAMIAGMRMDVLGPVCCPDRETFILYCRRVAVSAGLLSLPIMGATDIRSSRFAEELGHALQCVNIIRDVAEDAELGRCYIPKDLLLANGIEDDGPREIAAHPAIGNVRAQLAEQARAHFRNAHAALAVSNVNTLRPARLMMVGYQNILDRIESQGWSNLSRPAKPPKWKAVMLLANLPKPLQESNS